MGETPRKRDITIEFDCQFRVDLQSSDFSSIMKAFLILLPQMLEDFFQKVLVGFAEYKRARLEKVIDYCREKEFKHCVSYLDSIGISIFHTRCKISLRLF